MTSTEMTSEAVSCRRFLSAWERNKTRRKGDLDVDIMAQYLQFAQHFQRLLQDNELKSLEVELVPVAKEISLLAERAGVKPNGSIPKRSEGANTSENQDNVAKIQATEGEQDDEDQNPVAETTGTTENEKVDEKPVAEPKEPVAAPPELRTDLTADDFKSMLEMPTPTEEKLSTRAIRKRLGLTDRSGAQATASETVARQEQESIQSDMMSLAKQLKDRTQNINQTLAEDVKILDAVGQSAESNTTLLDRENTKLKEQLASSIGLWTSLWLVAMVVIVFVVTYFYMKLFSRRW